MKRYLLFAGQHYYPSGGWEDLDGNFDSINEALDHAKRPSEWESHVNDWYQIVDTQTMTVVCQEHF